jgi:hypothetical protein
MIIASGKPIVFLEDIRDDELIQMTDRVERMFGYRACPYPNN